MDIYGRSEKPRAGWFRLKSICCFLTPSCASWCCCWHPCCYSEFWRAWETAEPYHVTNWSGGQGERVGCQPACPHELHPYMPVCHPHRSSPTQNLLRVNGLKLCLSVCEPLHVCSYHPSASSGRLQAQLVSGGVVDRVAHGGQFGPLLY